MKAQRLFQRFGFGLGRLARVMPQTRVRSWIAGATVLSSMLLYQSVTANCEKSQIVYNKAEDAHVLQYPANNPIEDRWVYANLKSLPGKLAVVLDGHGGWAVCKLTSRPRVQSLSQ